MFRDTEYRHRRGCVFFNGGENCDYCGLEYTVGNDLGELEWLEDCYRICVLCKLKRTTIWHSFNNDYTALDDEDEDFMNSKLISITCFHCNELHRYTTAAAPLIDADYVMLEEARGKYVHRFPCYQRIQLKA